MKWQITTWLLVGDRVKHPGCHICCSVAYQLALGNSISTFIYHLAGPLEMPWWEGTSQPAMPSPVTFCDTFLLVCDAFTWLPLYLPPSAPASQQPELAGLAVFHYCREQQGQPLLNFFAPFSLKTRPCPPSSRGLCLPLWSELSGNITVLVTAARHEVARS